MRDSALGPKEEGGASIKRGGACERCDPRPKERGRSVDSSVIKNGPCNNINHLPQAKDNEALASGRGKGKAATDAKYSGKVSCIPRIGGRAGGGVSSGTGSTRTGKRRVKILDAKIYTINSFNRKRRLTAMSLRPERTSLGKPKKKY